MRGAPDFKVAAPFIIRPNKARPWTFMQADEVVWRALLHFAVREGVDALVDCGALLAGTSNRSAGQQRIVCSPLMACLLHTGDGLWKRGLFLW